ncbi:MAG TPA: ABC transporter substrate-binding protein [Candidatus Dormibacteraeota bacterium]|jgi:branched-chain amino acid transport system substrate-binding protein|nr:ABC transporter substrate-binding protein [Candidatus Dormibacteraeota bacterium]
MRTGARAIVLGLVLALSACGGSSTTGTSSSNSYQGKTIQLGAILSLTGAGGVYGPSSQRGMVLAVDNINNAGGVNGAKLSLDVRDDGSDKAQSQQVAQTLIQQGQLLALLGPTLSNSAVAVHPLAESFKIPILAVSTTGIHIVPDCNYPKTDPCTYVFRDSLGEETAIPTNIKVYAAKAHPSTGVLMVANDDKFSSDGGKIVTSTVGQYNIQLLDTISFSKTTADFATPVTKAVQKHPDVIFITSLGGIPAKIMIEARKQGFTGQFLGGNGFNTAVVSNQAGAAGMGAESGSAWYLSNTFPSNAEFVRDYKARYGNNPDQFAAQGYAAMLILADAAKRANLTFTDTAGDRTKLRDAMESVNIQTPLGPFQFTKNHDVKQTVWVIAMDGHGGFTLVQSVNPS